MRPAALVAAAVLGMAGPAAAQSSGSPAGFSVERLSPPPGPAAFFVAEDADVLPHLTWSAGITGSLMSRPIVLRDLIDGSEASEPVATRLGLDASAALGLGSRSQVGLALPVAAQRGDRLQGIGLDETPLDRLVLGDLRLHGKLRLAGRPGAPGPGLGVAAALSLPTGNHRHFAGERGVVLEWRLIGSYAGRRWRAAVDLGPRFRSREVVLLSPARPHGNELVAALAAEVIVPGLPRDAASVLAEYVVVRGDAPRGGDVRGPSPAEARIGARWRTAAGWSLLAGLGLGTSAGEVGSPAWRVVLGTRFDCSPAGDLDRDGVADRADHCRVQAEDRDGWQDLDGCPDPDDDGDGIPDDQDECRRQPEDFDRQRDIDGCPDR